MRKLIFFFVFILGLASMAYGGQKHTVELTDGSRIEGEVISLENGRYTLRTAHLGEIKVEASKVRKIETSHESAGPQGNLPEIPDAATIKTEMDKMQSTMMQNPEIMKTIAECLTDPGFQEMLKDPAINGAIQSQDIKTLLSNEKFSNALKHPKIQEIKRQLALRSD